MSVILPVSINSSRLCCCFFIEILDLVQINERAVRRQKGIELINDGLDVCDACGRRIEMIQLAVSLLRDNRRDRCLAYAGRAVKR